MSEVYNDNAVPFGSRVESIKRGTGAGTPVGDYVLENITLNRPTKIIERPNQIGEPNGWVAVNGFPTGSSVAQIATTDTERPKNGDWFEDIFDGATGATAERWVIVDVGTPYEMNGYHKANLTLRYSPNPPA